MFRVSLCVHENSRIQRIISELGSSETEIIIFIQWTFMHRIARNFVWEFFSRSIADSTFMPFHELFPIIDHIYDQNDCERECQVTWFFANWGNQSNSFLSLLFFALDDKNNNTDCQSFLETPLLKCSMYDCIRFISIGQISIQTVKFFCKLMIEISTSVRQFEILLFQLQIKINQMLGTTINK